VTCAKSGFTCATSNGVAGCCSGALSKCQGLYTACYGAYTQYCVDCSVPFDIVSCPLSAPYCATYQYESGLSGFGCGDVSGYTVSVLLTTRSQKGAGSLILPTPSTTSKSSSALVTTPTHTPSTAPSSSPISKGAIAGISVGSALVIAIIAAVLAFFCFRRSKSRRATSKISAQAPGWTSTQGDYQKDANGYNGSERPYSPGVASDYSATLNPARGYENVQMSPMGGEFKGYGLDGYVHQPVPMYPLHNPLAATAVRMTQQQQPVLAEMEHSASSPPLPPPQQPVVAEMGPSAEGRRS
jgi:hypothetical protein